LSWSESAWQTPSGLSCAFYWGVASVWPLYNKGLIGDVFLGIFNAAEMCWYPSPDLCLDTIRSMVISFDLMAWFLLCTLNRQECAFPNHVQSIKLSTGGLQSSCRNIKDDKWIQDAPELNF
jgi:hypothetical protein